MRNKIILWMIVFLICVMSSYGEIQIDNSGNYAGSFCTIDANAERCAETFQVNHTYNITIVRGWYDTTGAPINLEASIWSNDVNNKPDVVIDNATNSLAGVGGAFLGNFSFDGTTTLTPANYSVVYSSGGGLTAAKRWKPLRTTAVYSGGSEATSADNGATWTTVSATDFYFIISGINVSAAPVTTDPIVLLNSPTDTQELTTSTIDLIATAITNDVGESIDNITFYHNASGSWVANVTNTTCVNNTACSVELTFPDGIYNWNAQGCDDNSECALNDTNQTFMIDTVGPVVTDWNVTSNIVPGENTSIWNSNLNFSINVTTDLLCYTFTCDELCNHSAYVDSLTIYPNADANHLAATTDTTSQSNCVYDNFTIGNHFLYVSAIDNHSFVRNYTANFTRVQVNTTVNHFDIEVDEIVFDSSLNVLLLNDSFNVSKAGTTLVIWGGGGMRKGSTQASTIVSMRMDLNGATLFDEPIRTISGLADRGVFNIPINNPTASTGLNRMEVWARETGGGSVNISSFEIHVDTNISFLTNHINTNVTESDTTFSSTASVNIDNFTLEKTHNSSTMINIQHKFQTSGVGDSTPSCFVENHRTGERSPTYTRYLASSSDIGSSGINYKSKIFDQDNEIWKLWCRSNDADTITSNATIYTLDLMDSEGFAIDGFQNETTATQSLTAGVIEIARFQEYSPKNATEMDILATIIMQSTSATQSGDSSPKFTINSTQLIAQECSETYGRSLSSAADIGTAKIAVHCLNMTVGDSYNISVFANVAVGETLNILNVSLSAYEVTKLNTTEGNVPVIVSIITPVNNTNVSGVLNITWMANDPNGDTFLVNVTLRNSTIIYSLINNSGDTVDFFQWNSTAFDNGWFNLSVVAWENASTEKFVSNDTVLVNIRSTSCVIQEFKPIIRGYVVNYSKTVYSPSDWFMDGNYHWNLTDSNASHFNVTNFVYNITNNCGGNRSLAIHQNQTLEWYNLFALINAIEYNVTTTPQTILTLTNQQSILFNTSISILDASQNYTNWTLTVDRAYWVHNLTINIT